MKPNLNLTDATARFILGLIITFMGVSFASWWGLLALFPFATMLTGFCPLYFLLGINTLGRHNNNIQGDIAGTFHKIAGRGNNFER